MRLDPYSQLRPWPHVLYCKMTVWYLLLFVQLFLALGCDDTDLLEHTRALLQEMGPEETGGGTDEGEEGEMEEIGEGEEGEKEEIGEGEEGEDETQCSSEHGEHQNSMDVT